jgi:hypothetical protein
MNTPVSTPRIRAFVLSTANGEIQESEKVSAPPLTSATTANSSSAPTWAKIITRWMCADSSVPSTQIVVITAMISSVNTTFAAVESRRPSAPNRSNV